MKTALIGHTGFVGQNLYDQHTFSHCYNSKNIQDMRGEHFDEIWCAGVRAVKWWANQHPEEDWAGIELLLDILQTVHTSRFVLISTVDVYSSPNGKDESATPQREGLHPYGLHRLAVEDFVRENFAQTHIIRLPGLYGTGLKKNAIYDLLHNNQVEKIHAQARYQFYGLDTLFADCTCAIHAGLPLCHFAVEPTSMHDVAQYAFGRDFTNAPAGVTPALYDFKTQHAALFNGKNGYIQDRMTVLHNIQIFVSNQQKKQ